MRDQLASASRRNHRDRSVPQSHTGGKPSFYPPLGLCLRSHAGHRPGVPRSGQQEHEMEVVIFDTKLFPNRFSLLGLRRIPLGCQRDREFLKGSERARDSSP
jgi:hypothetical protein